MKWTKHCFRHLDLMIRVLSDIRVSLRKEKDSIKYKECNKLYDDLLVAKAFLSEGKVYLTNADMLYFYSRIFIWGMFYYDSIPDSPTKNITWLLCNQLRKKIKRTIQSINDKEAFFATLEIPEDEDIDPSVLNFIANDLD